VRTDATIFAHLLSGDGTIVAQADGHPLHGMLPMWLWDTGDAYVDVRRFGERSQIECHAGCSIRLGIWEPATGTRWTVAGRRGDSVLIPVPCP
jgi:hypothetical protein